MKGEKLSTREAAQILGVDHSTVARDVANATAATPSPLEDPAEGVANATAPLDLLTGLAATEAVRKEAAGQATRQQRQAKRADTKAAAQRQADLPDAKSRGDATGGNGGRS